MSPRSLQQAPFRVLVGANMPAVLVEMGFLTNPQQEQRLASDDYQNALVQALVDGIVRYRGATQAASDQRGALMHRRALTVILMIAVVVFSWLLFIGLPRYAGSKPAPPTPGPQATVPSPAPDQPRPHERSPQRCSMWATMG